MEYTNTCARFVELNLLWYGGEKELIRSVGENPTMRSVLYCIA